MNPALCVRPRKESGDLPRKRLRLYNGIAMRQSQDHHRETLNGNLTVFHEFGVSVYVKNDDADTSHKRLLVFSLR